MLPPSHHGLTGVVGEEADMLVQGRRSLVSIGGAPPAPGSPTRLGLQPADPDRRPLPLLAPGRAGCAGHHRRHGDHAERRAPSVPAGRHLRRDGDADPRRSLRRPAVSNRSMAPCSSLWPRSVLRLSPLRVHAVTAARWRPPKASRLGASDSPGSRSRRAGALEPASRRRRSPPQAHRYAPKDGPVHGEEGTMSDDNKALVKRLFDEVFSTENFDAADEIMADEYLEHAVAPFGREE